eukprot:1338808-Pyramimonas_sp.AAC.1
MDPGGKDARVPLGGMPILTVRVDCTGRSRDERRGAAEGEHSGRGRRAGWRSKEEEQRRWQDKR